VAGIAREHSKADQRRLERRVIASAALAHATTHGVELAYAALLLRIGIEFEAGDAILGVIATAGAVTFGAFALPSGWIVDRVGPRAVMASAMGSAAIFALFVALSPNLLVLALTLSLLGAGIGLYHPAGTAMVATVAERRGLALAAHGIAGNVGVGLAPAVAVGVAIAFDWRIAYVVLAAAAAVVALLVLRITPSREEAATAAATRRAATQASPAASRHSMPPAVRTWRTPSLLLIYGWAIGTGFIYRGSLTFLPAHLERNLDISILGWNAEGVAGAATTLILMTAIFGQLSGGLLSDRVSLERLAIPFAVLVAAFLALMAPASGVVLLVTSAGFVFANFAQQPIVNGLITDYSPEGAVGRAFGISFTLTFGVGSVAGGVAGLLAERSGTPAAFYALAIVGAVVIAGMVAVEMGARRRRIQQDAARYAEVAGG
jgi:MFS family permease